jgi:hypothetical protein
MINKIKKGSKQLSKKQQQAISKIPLSPTQILTKREEQVSFDQPVFSRTGLSSYSFDNSTQLFFVNLGNILNTTLFWTSSVLDSTGKAQYEYVMVHHLNFEWFPSEHQSTSTFMPAAFNLRYMDAYSDDTNLPSSYNVATMPVNLRCLIAQTSSPQSFRIEASNRARFGEGDSSTVGQLQCVGTYTGQSGILVLNQPSGTVNTTASFNPLIGSIKITFGVTLLNAFY